MRQEIFSWRQYIQRLMAMAGMLLLASGLVALPANATGVYQMPLTPPANSRVVDEGEILSRLNEGQISKKFKTLAEETGYQTWLVTIHRLDYGLSIEDFTNQLFEKWFPTPEVQANQTLIAIDNVTNNAGIRTGESVKSLLTDDIAESVVNETIQVPLIQGDKYNSGPFLMPAIAWGWSYPVSRIQALLILIILLTWNALIKLLKKLTLVNSSVVVIVLLIVATVIPMVTYYWYQS